MNVALFPNLFAMAMRHRRVAHHGIHLITAVMAFYGAFLLRFDGQIPPTQWRNLWISLPIVLTAKLVLLDMFGLNRCIWRYFGLKDLVRLFLGATVSSVVIAPAILWAVVPVGFPRSVFVLDWCLTLFGLGGKRCLIRYLRPQSNQVEGERRVGRVLICGAGRTGETACRLLRNDPLFRGKIIGFLDDDPTIQGTTLSCVPVLGGLNQAAEVIRELRPDTIMLGIPSASKETLRALVQSSGDHPVSWKIHLPIDQLLNEEVGSLKFRTLEVEDLFGSDSVGWNQDAPVSDFEGKSVLITGAGGAIGKRIALRIAQFRPAELVLCENGESRLFEIDRVLRNEHPELTIRSIIADLRYRGSVEAMIEENRPQRILHLAAYKHIPMMQSHPLEAVFNNFVGTFNLVRAGMLFGCEKLLFASTIKAADPSSILGATMRAAEITVQTANARRSGFFAARLGSVLGTSGSVVPIFQQQIVRGGPLTVTDPYACRSFMSLKDAEGRILQAMAMGDGGETFLMDMGEPVKIMDLAHAMIRLSGKVPERQIRTQVVGLRPGESLHEISWREDAIFPTEVPGLYFMPPAVPPCSFEELGVVVDRLNALISARREEDVREALDEFLARDGALPPETSEEGRKAQTEPVA